LSRGTPSDSAHPDPFNLPDLLDRGTSEHYADPSLYDFEYRRRRQDVSFYRQLAGELLGGPGTILELACGSGRLSTALLRDGHRVLGVDLARPMVSRAATRIARLGRSVRSRAMLVRGDMRRFAFGERFPLVLMAFNSFEHLYTRTDAAACLARIREHLEPGGRFVFDVQNPNLRWLTRDPGRRWARTVFRHPSTGRRVVYTTSHEYDPISQIVVIQIFYDPAEGEEGRPEVHLLSQRKFFPAELEALIAANGFAVERSHGDFDGGPLHADADTQLLVCRLR
jgi:SAM-dependent methyltransferase